MFIKHTTKKLKGRTYVNHLLVESVATPKGPRHRVVCSLGSLAPAPKQEWAALARRIQASLEGQSELEPDEQVEAIAERAREAKAQKSEPPDSITVRTDSVRVEEAREAGGVHVGHQIWQRLEMDRILTDAGLSDRARLLAEVMTMNRLVSPTSEHAMPDWIRRSALGDILGIDFEDLADDALYRNLDRLHPNREGIEQALSDRERTLFNLENTVYLYDLTSTYFEGLCAENPQAKRGYSRDKRPDCKQVVVGLVLDPEGFPKAHEVFDGNRQDRTTVDQMLEVLERRTGQHGGATVVVDRGMAYAENLQQICARGHHYVVASRQGERTEHLEEFEDEAGWREVIRQPSPRNPAQKKPRVWVKQSVVGEEVHVLCRSEGRIEKDRAIREKQAARLLADLSKLRARVNGGRLREVGKIHESIGRLKERYPRVARYYQVDYDAEAGSLSWQENREKKEKAAQLDGVYMLKTDRRDMTDEEIWRLYMLLTRVEAAFRSMKSPLMERPIFHHLKDRVQGHIFLCVLAYHLLVSIEKTFLDAGVHTSWATLREQLSTHQVVTIVLPTSDGGTLKIRKGTTAEPIHQEIYRTLRIPSEPIKPIKTWEAG